MNFSHFRIIDANINRFREGLRVIEEWCRFRIENEKLAQECKNLRHELTEIFIESGYTKEFLLKFRDTDADIGTKISTKFEYQKSSEKEILLANFGRIQESLRVLEEFGKLQQLGAECEKLRYRTYTLEKEVLQSLICSALNHPIYILLTKSLCRIDYFDLIKRLCDAGAKIFQIREKDLPDSQLLELVQKVVKLTKPYGALVIVNDRPDIALIGGADGVHLGSEDLPIKDVRLYAGRPFIIGATVHSIHELEELPISMIDYVGVGPCFSSTTKPNLIGEGPQFIHSIIEKCSVPTFAIGGISQDNIQELLFAGIRRIAICSAIISNADPVKAYLSFLSHLPKVDGGADLLK